ncbi:MAG TPA: glucoamylase family protein [Vicinamibacterales bacterium]|nr:glucoamylase family protein [Vicinamibacterales bacterium]
MTIADPPVELTPPIPLTTSQLESHAARIAATHAVSDDPRRARPLLPKLEKSGARLDEAYLFLSAAARPDEQPVGAEEWLRDNHHIVQDQVRDVRQHLPRKYYLELPKLAAGGFEGYPRVYLLARELIAHTAGRIDLETITDFTSAYQRIAPLTIGEIWAVPIMLRLALVEELDRLAGGVVDARRRRAVAKEWHGRLSSTDQWDERSIAPVLDSGRDEDGRLAPAFVVELLQWLRDQPATAAAFSHALHRALEAQDDSAEEMLRLEHQREAADQLAIGNAITSMRLLSSIDWTVFFERTSLVERILREDPAGAYPLMDFPTRDRYRHAVEGLAKRAGVSENAVAQTVLDCAAEARQHDPAHDRRHHVGYYLISRGRFELEKAIHYRPTGTERFARFFFAHPALGYLATIAVMTAVGIASLLLYAERHGAGAGALFWIGLVLLIPMSELAISILHLVLTNQIPPRPLPKLRLDEIPPELRTMVVVPAMITSARRVDELVADLEVRFLGNRHDNLHFALLTDFADADARALPWDEALLSQARECIAQLNARYGSGRFYLFHRERRWNPAEGRWMGWERKRGKLVEFNRLLRGGTGTSFIVSDGDLSVLPTVRYVITLDSDTQLPMNAASRLIGTLAHPLNKPRFDPSVGRVTEGYGVLQPAIAVDLVSANRTRFAQVFSGHVGIDPYTTAFSDVYQDLFHEGSYVGKGIYDVEAFEAALAGRVPENRLLSHDLFEGSYARTALCTDILLVDDYPAQYLAFASRQHRWVRGDWQIMRWVWRTVPDAGGRTVRNVLPVTPRWKIFDNLRRSLLAPSLIVLLAAGWTVLPRGPLAWTSVALLVFAFPVLAQLARSLTSRVRGVPLVRHVAGELPALALSAQQTILWIALQLHQAVLMLDAIIRTLWRLLVTRRRLLEWVAADRFAGMSLTPAKVLRSMWHSPVLALAMMAVVTAAAPDRLPAAVPFILLWFCSPALVLASGQPTPDPRQRIDDSQRAALRMIARRTWLFFEELFGPGDHWLIPDNYQENRAELIAHRTSPTNIGLQLISTFAAYDFGYLSAAGVIARLEPAFGTLLKLQRYRGHFYNWYDTRTLMPLVPEYVSSVDSGNFAGYLLATRMGLLQLSAEPRIHVRALDGIRDALNLCAECLADAAGTTASPAARALADELKALNKVLLQRPETETDWRTLLTGVDDHLSSLGIAFREVEDSAMTPADESAVASAAVWLEKAAAALADHRASLQMEAADVQELAERAERLAGLADDLVEEMDFEFLYDRERGLFSIGYNVVDGRLDRSFYDALASEARLTSFVAITTGQIAPEHWFRLGRSLTPTGTERALLSWSGSMFEYFMPLLVMRAYPGTLLDETYRAVIARQVHYASTRNVPWGISESAYYAHDLDKNYQYRAFGVPGLGLKRGLADDLVIAPYASALAAPLVAGDVLKNLERLRDLGMSGRYGFYEAIDFTPARVPEKSDRGIVLRTYMAHHQGMTLAALDNALHDYPMQRRFHDDPRVQSADLLLQERIPHQVPLKNAPIELVDRIPSARDAVSASARVYLTPHTLSPRCHTISNGSYVVMVTNAGGGYSQRQQTALTRWREDITRDAWGSFCYIRDLDSRLVWSTTYLPVAREPDEYECTFAPDRAVFRRVDGDIETRTEIVVSPEDDVELRRVSVTNLGTSPRRLDLTSYAEVVLAPGDADLAHPAFSNLFVETRSVPGRDALIATRRPRSGTDRRYLVHLLSGRGPGAPDAQFETDRAKFIGRGGSLERPLAMTARTLSNTTGAVLDPIVSLRRGVRLAPGATARLTFTTGYAETEAAALGLIDKYADRRAIARAIALAAAYVPIELRHLGLTMEDTFAFQRLGGRLLIGDPRLRDLEAVERNRCGQRDLWKFGISGDLPIALVRVTDDTGLPLVADLLKAHEYLRRKGLVFDLVVLNEHAVTYLQSLHETLERTIESSPEHGLKDTPGGVFLRRADLMSKDDQLLLRAAARVAMDAAEGRLRNQLARPHVPFVPEPTRTDVSDRQRAVAAAAGAAAPAAAGDLEFFNGSGGFASDGREYVVRTGTALPPVPWTNVIAHETFGFACTESSAGYTWSGSSHDNRLTPWNNDPVADAAGEAVFIRNEETGAFWSATPLPAGAGQPYQTRHGQGYSVYEHTRNGIASELTLFVPRADPAKIFRLALRNTGTAPLRLSVTLYVEWVLGENRSRTATHVVTAADPDTGAVLATNRFRPEFASHVGVLDLWCETAGARTFTGDRTEFIGRNGSLARPAALGRDQLSNRVGAGHDPCGAIRVQLDLDPLEERVVLGLIGDVDDAANARGLVERFRDRTAVDAALAAVRAFWDGLLGTVTVRTPDRAMDLIVNRWLLYQTVACRIWGRSAFYQSSGAFGFRDQLQDTLAALAASPSIVRDHLLRAAGRQFVEGDVQHWWHEPGGQGVRTRFSDDRLWLPYATLHYLAATGDAAVLEEQVPFLAGRILDPDEHEAYERPTVAAETASLYEHCLRAIDISLATGSHGLPLMGTGDWNDGMSLVGAGGKGESVWLGWFLVSILRPFADLSASRGDAARAARYREFAATLAGAVEAAWDGDWYRRAYFDDGTPLGSKENAECQIDAIAQSWAVICGAGDPARARQAMASVDDRLVREEDGLVLLLTPPFDRMEPSPGYIRGYLPGVRENGGQYTHAALWNVLAFATLGDGDRAFEMFSLLNPVNHGRTPEEVMRYRAEPYVVAADVYSAPPHTGRGGWTWYTGSAGWMHRVAVEAILGINIRNGALHIDPCIPGTWREFEVVFAPPGAHYRIQVDNPEGVCRGVVRLEVDGTPVTGDIPILRDGASHDVRVILGG